MNVLDKTDGGRTEKNFAYGLLAAAIALFCLTQFYMMGDRFLFFIWDEVAKLMLTVRTAAVFSGREPLGALHSLPTTDMPLFMYNDYVGAPWLVFAALSVMLLGPFMGIFPAFQLVFVLAGVLTLLAVFFVVGRRFGKLTAALAVFFMSANYVYVHSMRQSSEREEVFQIFGFWAGFALCQWAVDSDRRWPLLAGFFVFGVTLWAKIMFFGYMLAFAAVFLFMGRSGRARLFGALFPSLRSAVSAAAAFAVGAMPLIVFNAQKGFATVKVMWLAMFLDKPGHAMPDGWNNWALFSNLARRVRDLHLYLSGGLMHFYPSTYNFVFVGLFVCALVWGLVSALRADSTKTRFALKTLFVFYGTLLVLTCFVPTQTSPGHILIMAPFPELLCALFAVFVIGHLPRRARTLCALLLCAVWIAPQIASAMQYRKLYIVDENFSGLYVSECKRLSARLEGCGARNVVAFEPIASMLMSTGSRLNVLPVLDLVHEKDFAGLGPVVDAAYAREPDNLFLLAFYHCPEIELHKELRAFLLARGYKAVCVKRGMFRGWEYCRYWLFRIRRVKKKSAPGLRPGPGKM